MTRAEHLATAPNGGYTCVRRTEGLLRSVIGAVVQVPDAARTPPWDVAAGFSGWSPEPLQFFKGLQADNAQGLLERAQGVLRDLGAEPVMALLDELGGKSARGWIARPCQDVRFRGDESPYKTAACSASCGPIDGWLDVHHRRPVDCLQGVDFDPKPVTRHDAGTVQADGVWPIG